MKRLKQVIVVVMILLLLALPIRIAWFLVALNFKVDFSQEYRKVKGYEDILFVQENTAYKRTFWGLKEIPLDTASLGEESCFEDEKTYEMQKDSREEDYYFISKMFLSPDRDQVLYEEVRAWGAGAPTDDNDIYYRVLNLTDGSIHTFFKMPMRQFDLYWQ